MAVQSRWRLASTKHMQGNRYPEKEGSPGELDYTKPEQITVVEFEFNASKHPTFGQATPMGTIRMTVANPEAIAILEKALGSEFYATFEVSRVRFKGRAIAAMRWSGLIEVRVNLLNALWVRFWDWALGRNWAESAPREPSVLPPPTLPHQELKKGIESASIKTYRGK